MRAFCVAITGLQVNKERMVFYAKTPCINYATVFYWRLSVHIVGILSVFEVDEMTDAKLSPFHTYKAKPLSHKRPG